MRDLLQYCRTDKQKQLITAWYDAGENSREAARNIGHTHQYVSRCVALMRQAQAEKTITPDIKDNKMPDGYIITNGTMQIGPNGVERVWPRYRVDQKREFEAMREAVAAMCEEIAREPESPLNLRPLNSDLVTQYTITDYHIGMLSWGEETGADWDVSIAEDLLVGWFAEAIKSAPDSEVGIFAQLGDMMHWDGLEAVTPTSKHVLDADTRFSKVVRIAIRAMRRIMRMLLQKHAKIHVIMAEGNHDIASSVWLREMFAALYEEESRVFVDVSPDPYYCYEHGEISLFYHHGHKRKPQNIDDVFVAKFREVFGRTKKSYAHMGHMHHTYQKETSLMLVEQHRTLAAPDAHASRGGWMSQRDAKAITYHKKFGEVGRITICPEMIQK